VLLPDHGTRYLNKVYNDNWMKDHGFLEERSFGSARDILRRRVGNTPLFTIQKNSNIGEAIRIMNQQGIDQVPVVDGNEFVGSISASNLLEKIIEDPHAKDAAVGALMDKPMQFVSVDTTLDVLSSMLNKNNKALLVRDDTHLVHIITQHDILKAMTA
jgi:cystathionine beta-synthase